MSVLGPTLGTRSAGERRLGPRFVVFGIAVMLAVTGLGLRLFQLQVAQGSFYQSLGDQRQMVSQPIPVARGIIYDRRGEPLVQNVPTFVLRIRPSEIPTTDRSALADRLARLLDVPAYTIIERLDAHTGSQFDLVRIGDVKTDIARVISEDPSQFPGVHVELEARRKYLQGKLMSHVLGWTGRISGPEYERAQRRRLLARGPHREGRPRGDLRVRAPWHLRPPGGRGRRRRQRDPLTARRGRARRRAGRSS